MVLLTRIGISNVKRGNGIIGLMFKRHINQFYSFPLGKVDKSIHTMFCFCAMDSICLDENNMVIKKIHMPPWKIFYCGATAKMVIEGPVDAFRAIKIGDIIEF